MRGRARLVFSVTVGGICAAFVAPSASLAAVPITSIGPGHSRAPIRITRSSRPVVGGPSAFPAPGREMLPQLTLIDFTAPAGRTSATLLPVAAAHPATPFKEEPTTTVAPAPPPPPDPPVPAPAPIQVPAQQPVQAPQPPVVQDTGSSLGGVWACIRQAESSGNYGANTGNGYYGAYQFLPSTWVSVGGSGLPSDAPPAEQDMRAQMLQQRSGWGQWSTHSMCGV